MKTDDLDDVLFADGFDEALLGVIRRPGQKPIAIYDTETCIEILIVRDGLSMEEAIEYFEYNVSGAWVGEGTPGFLEQVEQVTDDGGASEVDEEKPNTRN